MKNTTIGLFPGQGSQSVGMGESFFSGSEEAKRLGAVADAAIDFPLSELCLNGPIEKLTLTEFAQPAILLVSYIAYKLADIPLGAAAGHSLGEYTALVASGALPFEEAIPLVHKRGRYMQEAVPQGQGKMVAVMGPTEAEIRQVIESIPIGVKEVANLNSPGQTVVAGDVTGVEAFAIEMGKLGGKIIPLNVSAPFHCSLMKPAADKLALDLDRIDFKDPTFPVYANVNGKAVTTGAMAREMLKQQVCGSVRWVDCMTNSVEELGITRSVEFGAGGVLSKLLKRINPTVSRVEIASLEDIAKAGA